MWQKSRRLVCRLGFHKWESLPTDNYFKMELTPDGKLAIHKGSVMVDNVIPSISKCKYCNKVLVKTSPWEKGKIMDWWGGIRDVAED